MPSPKQEPTNQSANGDGRWLAALRRQAAVPGRGRLSLNPKFALRLAGIVLILDMVAVLGFMPESLARFKASQTNQQGQVTTGTVAMTMAPVAGLSGTMSNLAPGDVVQLTADLSSTSTLLSSVKLTTSATGSLVLFDPAAGPTPAGDAFTLGIDKCTSPWTGTSPNITCGGTASVVLAAGSTIKQTAAALTNLTVTQTGSQTDRLRFTVTLPATGGDNQNRNTTATITFKFTATQRPATKF